jgi:hypothetical protein
MHRPTAWLGPGAPPSRGFPWQILDGVREMDFCGGTQVTQPVNRRQEAQPAQQQTIYGSSTTPSDGFGSGQH